MSLQLKLRFLSIALINSFSNPSSRRIVKEGCKIEKGAGNPLTTKVGTVTKQQIREIAEIKLSDLNTTDVEAAMRTIEGTARQMGLTVKSRDYFQLIF